MSGYREFRPGQIWFYYNPNATKDLENQKNLGAITCRPVVIVQNAYYPEWSDSVTVIPMTSSDRRSGIHIDTTILHDGSIIEGGTVLPYLFYTVKTRFLHAMTSDRKGEKLHLISLSDEDYDLVKEAIAWHLGLSKDVPAYVKEWKTLDDYERSTITRQIRLVVNDFENQQRKVLTLVQEKDPSPVCENHVNAGFDRVSADRTQFLSKAGNVQKSETADGAASPTVKPSSLMISEAREYKKNHTQNTILFTPLSPEKWAEAMEPHMDLEAKEPIESRIFPGSKVLVSVPYNQVHTVLTQNELDVIQKMSATDVMKNTGAPSKATAYRIRKQASLVLSTVNAEVVETVPVFHYNAREAIRNRSTRKARAKRIKRYKILFGLSKEECDYLMQTDVAALQERFPTLALSEIKQLKVDASTMYPNRQITVSEGAHHTYIARYSDLNKALVEDATKSFDAEFNTTYDLWETLAPTEISEIASASKRNAINVAKKYGVSKSNFGDLRSIAIELTKPNGKIKQPEINEDRKRIACNKVIHEDLTTVSSMDILIFCRTNYTQIISLYGKCGSPNTPSKRDIADLKRNLRKIIVRKKISKS